MQAKREFERGAYGIPACGQSEAGEIRRDAARSGRSGMGGKPYGGLTAPARYGNAGELTLLEYKEGDRVSHTKFGEGTVTAIVAGGRDFEVSVDFDRVGPKKMFASFAKLKKLC